MNLIKNFFADLDQILKLFQLSLVVVRYHIAFEGCLPAPCIRSFGSRLSFSFSVVVPPRPCALSKRTRCPLWVLVIGCRFLGSATATGVVVRGVLCCRVVRIEGITSNVLTITLFYTAKQENAKRQLPQQTTPKADLCPAVRTPDYHVRYSKGEQACAEHFKRTTLQGRTSSSQ